MRCLITLLITLGLVNGMNGFAQVEDTDDYEDAMADSSLSAAKVDALEAAVKENPNKEISARKKLLGYYFLHHDSKGDSQARLNHILWFVKNQPAAQIAGLAYTQLNPISDGASYDQVKKLWLEQVEKQSATVRVLGNAANFFLLHDSDIAEKLLKQAQQAEPKNPEWSERLGHLYSLQRTSGGNSAAKAFEQFEKAQAADSSTMTRFYRLDDLAKSAFRAGQLEKATAYANELLATAKKCPNDWNYGNALHHGNNVLGLVALKKGNQKEAANYFWPQAKHRDRHSSILLVPI